MCVQHGDRFLAPSLAQGGPCCEQNKLLSSGGPRSENILRSSPYDTEPFPHTLAERSTLASACGSEGLRSGLNGSKEHSLATAVALAVSVPPARSVRRGPRIKKKCTKQSPTPIHSGSSTGTKQGEGIVKRGEPQLTYSSHACSTHDNAKKRRTTVPHRYRIYIVMEDEDDPPDDQEEETAMRWAIAASINDEKLRRAKVERNNTQSLSSTEQHVLQSSFKAKRARLQETFSSSETLFFSPVASSSSSDLRGSIIKNCLNEERRELQSVINTIVDAQGDTIVDAKGVYVADSASSKGGNLSFSNSALQTLKVALWGRGFWGLFVFCGVGWRGFVHHCF